MPCAPIGRWMCAASPARKTRPWRYRSAWRLTSVVELTHSGVAPLTSSPVRRCQVWATSSKVIGSGLVRSGSELSK